MKPTSQAESQAAPELSEQPQLVVKRVNKVLCTQPERNFCLADRSPRTAPPRATSRRFRASWLRQYAVRSGQPDTFCQEPFCVRAIDTNKAPPW
jgi:hypothetical protein